MATIVPSGKVIDFEYSAADGNTGLFVAMKIYDLSSGSPVLSSTVGMSHVFNGSYWGTFTFPASASGKNFMIQKSCYTSGAFTTLAHRPPGSEFVEVDGFDGNQGRAT